MKSITPSEQEDFYSEHLRTCYEPFFDREYYQKMNPELDFTSQDPLDHFLVTGWRDGRNPSADIELSDINPPAGYKDCNPFLYYVHFHGKEELFRSFRDDNEGGPSYRLLSAGERMLLENNLDLPFYRALVRKHLNVRQSMSLEEACQHFYEVGAAQGIDPNPGFSLSRYTAAHPDVLSQGRNPFLHYLTEGQEQGRTAYTSEYSTGDTGGGPTSHDLISDLEAFTRPGPDFEELDIDLLSKHTPLVHLMAYYLPQFHSIPENDAWWGKGFTEWRNVTRGVPRFEGHYQPRLPRDLGFYDLLTDGVMAQQVEMAKAAGISSFCFYYYNFGDKRLLEKPLDLFLQNKDLNIEFSLMWANESWSRTWDGFENDVLMKQGYDDSHLENICNDIGKCMKDPRYLRIEGRPLLTVYRPGAIPDSVNHLRRMREMLTEVVGTEPYIYMVQAFNEHDPIKFGLDGALEFPPHKVAKGMSNINPSLTLFDPGFEGHVLEYDKVVVNSLAEPTPPFPQIKTLFPSWDNDARRPGRGFVVHGSTPQKYQQWLKNLCLQALHREPASPPIVGINAWNEWAEAAYLEPDMHYGASYLNATARALVEVSEAPLRLLLVGHDLHRHGAQLLLLNLGETLKREFGIPVAFLVGEGGSLLDAYSKVGTTYICPQGDTELISESLRILRSKGFSLAITNTVVTGRGLVEQLHAHGFSFVSLIHELPRLIEEYKLSDAAAVINQLSSKVIFPAEMVKKGFEEVIGETCQSSTIFPQGLYANTIKPAARKNGVIRKKLDIQPRQKIIINVGFADLRKGLDQFLCLAREAKHNNLDLFFIWVGRVDPTLESWLMPEMIANYGSHFAWVDFTSDVQQYYTAADIFFLTSREDPYPSVVLEALAAGLPVVGYKGCTGTEQLISDHGSLVDAGDTAGALKAIQNLLKRGKKEQVKAAEARTSWIAQNYSFRDYSFRLAQFLQPSLQKVSVIVPNYNYAQHLEERLASIFEQTYPVYEIIVLDDASSDNSIDVVKATAAHYRREISLVKNVANSGNVFRQWQKGISLATADYIWIAEADDIAAPGFLRNVMHRMHKQQLDMSFCDSRIIDAEGKEKAASYQFYYDTIAKGFLAKDCVFEGPALLEEGLAIKNFILNGSAVVWKKDLLVQCLDKIGDTLFDLKVAGDWLLYTNAALAGARVGYVSQALNAHRRHETSVTKTQDQTAHYKEIEYVQDFAVGNIDASARLKQDIENYRSELKQQFGLK